MNSKEDKKKIKRMDAGLRKKQIIDCATHLFGKNGYSQTQISDILQAVGVSRGTIYQYFNNKDDIFAAVLENLYSDWKKVLSEFLPSDSDEYKDGKKFFTYQITITIKFFIDNPDYCNILLNIGLGVNEKYDAMFRRLDKQMVEFVFRYIKSGIKLGRIRSGIDLELMSNIIGGSLMRVIYYYIVPQKDQPGFDLHLLAERFVDYMSYGIFMEKPLA